MDTEEGAAAWPIGDGRRATPAQERAALPRERIADRVEVTADDRTGRTVRCENEADILGLKDEWRERHVAGCVEREGKRPRR